MLITILIILFTALFLSAAYWRISMELSSQLERELLSRSVESMHSQLSTALDTVQGLTTQVIRQSTMQRVSGANSLSSQELAVYSSQISGILDTAISTSSTSATTSIQFINIYLKNGNQFCSLSPEHMPYQNYDDCYRALQSCGLTDLDGYVPTCWFDDLSFQNISVSSRCLIGARFLYEDVTLEKIGIILVGVKQSSLQKIFSSLPSDSFLVRGDGAILSATKSKDIGQSMAYMDILTAHATESATPVAALPDGSEAFVYRLAGGVSWLVCPIDSATLTKSSARSLYVQQAVLIVVVALLLACLLSWLSANGLTKSLVRLKAVVQRVYEGNLTARFQTDQHDEIAYLGMKINDMLDQVEHSFSIQERDAAEKRDLELQLMQAQINPHLLYNTLNSVVWIIRQKDTEKAEELILSLGSFFRLALSKGNEEVSLSNELTMIQYYLKIQNLGRGKSFTLRDEVPERERSCKLLRLTLQPLAENAVIHGFSDWRDDGELVVSAKADDEAGLLQIFFSDNGIGILPDELAALGEELHAYPPQKERKHYGLYNIDRRIKNKYGPQYGLQLESEVGDYTTITVTLPLNREDNHDSFNAD